MKPSLLNFALVAAMLVPAGAAGQPPKESKGDMRVITRTERPGPPARRTAAPREKETVAFLGVHASPASRTIAVQLGLPAGSGLVVNHVVPDSPAAGVLQEHDILLKLDEQLLIETRQLSVLIRQHKEGDEVSLTFLRAGKQETARVKLGRQEVPKMSGAFDSVLPGAPLHGFAFGPGRFEMLPPEHRPREEADRVLSLIQPAPPGGAPRPRVEGPRGPGLRAMSVHPANSNLVYSDDEGSLELTIANGAKWLVAKDAKGKQLFSGSVNTAEEREKLPPAIRGRLDKLEGMHGISFRTDEEFRGAEARIFQPFGRGISLPRRPAAPPPPSPPRFF